MHSLTCSWMHESYRFSLQIQAIGLVTVQFIAHNRTSQPLQMSTMHTQLVGAACMGIEGEEGYWVMGGG